MSLIRLARCICNFIHLINAGGCNVKISLVVGMIPEACSQYAPGNIVHQPNPIRMNTFRLAFNNGIFYMLFSPGEEALLNVRFSMSVWWSTVYWLVSAKSFNGCFNE